MSCWVVPTVAAEYWGVSLDVVWRRIYDGLVPYKNDRGFVFVDVDPWTPDATGTVHHEPPPTFVTPKAPLLHQPVASTARGDEPRIAPVVEQKREAVGTLNVRRNPERNDDRVEEVRDDDDELPPLDDEESATFTRFTWQEVRQRVSRTRRPPPAFKN